MNKKNTLGLFGLYLLLFLAVCLFHQFKYYSSAPILFGVTVMIIVFFWGYLYQKKIISLSIFSTTLQKNLPKNERRFLYALGFLLAPVLKLRDISLEDSLLSLLFIAVPIILCLVDEKRLTNQEKS